MDKKELYKIMTTPKSEGGKNKIHESGFAKLFPNEYNELNDIVFPDNFVFRQKLYHYLKDDYGLELGKCKYCGNAATFVSLEDGYCIYCSKTCAQRHLVQLDKTGERKKVYGFAVNNNREKAKRTCLEKLGVENPQQLKSVQERSLKTKRKRYGERCEEITKKIKRTKKARYGDENYNNQEAAKKTNLGRYGAENVFASEYGKMRIRETSIRVYGVEHPMKNKEISDKVSKTKLAYTREKKDEIQRKLHMTWDCKTEDEIRDIVNRGKETRRILYGDENYNNRDLYRITCTCLYGGIGWASKYIKKKCGDTLELRHGVRHNMQIPSCVEKAKVSAMKTRSTEDYAFRMREKYYDIYKRYIENGLTPKGGVSEIELETFKFLKDIFDDVVPQYVSDVYPYKCDFYIRSLDLYIEINAHWTHGGHPFDPMDGNDMKTLDKWKSANSRCYNIAINTWTVRDVEKREMAKSNNLNYLEIFSCDLDEIKKTVLEYANCL